ncbi:MAG: hypothetical protein JW862_09740 [Anaerolineales bacterium]|nr:hypothetical protein [Anaerolineales bacterium]
MIAVQYLENTTQTLEISPQQAEKRLQAACERLPIRYVILGWALPPALVETCAKVCARHGTDLFYWQPLLSGDGVLQPRPQWRAIGLQGEAVPGFRGLPEFTFHCPNRPGLRAAIQARVAQIVTDGYYNGLFLDRMRYPSPVEDPGRWLACFCPGCQEAAAKQGLDLMAVQAEARRLLNSANGANELLRTLLQPETPEKPHTALLRAFKVFRQGCITDLVLNVCEQVQAAGKQVGLDCFAPTLTGLVAQSLHDLAPAASWIKPMLYGHTLGPAGLPFELLALLDWLIHRYGLTEQDAFNLLARSSALPLPATRAELMNPGLSEAALAHELKQARKQIPTATLLTGIELVNLPGVTHLTEQQLRRDLQALKQAGTDGLVLSWDLWHIPPSFLEIIHQEWL